MLRLTADVKQDEKTVFLVEVQQAGIFEVSGLEGERLEQVLTITCPTVLFPYGREAVDALVTKGSFPALMLAPINFEAVYMQAKKNQAEKAAAAFQQYYKKSGEEKAVFLEAIAAEIMNTGDTLIAVCCSETGFPQARFEGARGSSVNQ